jgi:hypothetical protein
VKRDEPGYRERRDLKQSADGDSALFAKIRRNMYAESLG